MKFNLSFGNGFVPGLTAHQIFTMLSSGTDMVRFIRYALEDGGHRVSVNRTYVDSSAVNLFFERFRIPENALELRRRGYRYGLICTEPLTTEGQYNPFEYDAEASRLAYESFAISVQNAEFVWYLLESAGPLCKKLNPNSHFFPFGFVSDYAELSAPAAREFQIDFFISGQISEHRQAVAQELQRRGFVVELTAFEPTFIRDSVLERSRATLSIQKSARHAIFSITRVHHAIMNRVPIIVEYEGPPIYLASYCLVAPPTAFLDVCTDFAKRGNVAAHAQAMYDRLQREMPMKPVMEKLVRDSGLAERRE